MNSFLLSRFICVFGRPAARKTQFPARGLGDQKPSNALRRQTATWNLTHVVHTQSVLTPLVCLVCAATFSFFACNVCNQSSKIQIIFPSLTTKCGRPTLFPFSPVRPTHTRTHTFIFGAHIKHFTRFIQSMLSASKHFLTLLDTFFLLGWGQNYWSAHM